MKEYIIALAAFLVVLIVAVLVLGYFKRRYDSNNAKLEADRAKYEAITKAKEICEKLLAQVTLALFTEAERKFGSQETLVCLGTRHALNARIARSRKSEHTPKHPLKRWCDDEWERWQEEPYFGKLPVRKIDVSRYRDPWERSQQLPIIFHNKRGRKPKSK